MNGLYDIKLRDKEIALSAEELVTMFNRNISKNAELLDYIGRNNLFGIIGKARSESVHSRFVAELLSGDFFNGDSRESTLFHFLDLLLYRSAKEGKSGEINPNLKKGILTRSVLFEKAASFCELPVKNYQKLQGRNKTKTVEKEDRIDIYLQYKLMNKIAGRDTLEIFIENKVNSSEFDSQTCRYFDACDNGGHIRPFQLFVYLTPQPVRDMDKYRSIDSKCKPACSHYIHICYQDVLDYIIEPLLADERLDEDKKAMLKEYVSCLELPAMPDADTQLSAKDLSIMAISTKERNLVHSFMEDAINRRLVEKSIATKLGEPLYTVNYWGTLFSATEALNGGLQGLINSMDETLEVLKSVADCGLVGKQNGADPFLVYSPEAWRSTMNQSGGGTSIMCKYLPYDHLYVFSGKVFCSINSALAAAIEEYKDKLHKTNEELVSDFSGIFSAKGGGVPLVSENKQKDNVKTGIQGIFMRKNVPADRLPSINAILGEDLLVEPIDNETYCDLLHRNVQIYINEPITENGLPQEIDDLVEDVMNYEQVGETPFFFRKDIVGDKILKINQIKLYSNHDIIEKCSDTSLLLDFYNSRRNLILSVYKIQLEAETIDEVYDEKLAIYRKLLKQ